jgi:hypothetical protein
MTDETKDFGTSPGGGFRHITNYEKDRRSDLSEPAPKSPGPWTASLPMDSTRAQRLYSALEKSGASEQTLEQFRREMTEAGHQQAPDPQIAKDLKASGLSQLKPSDLNPEIDPQAFTPEASAQIRNELGEFAVALQLNGNLANSLITHLTKAGPAFRAKSASEKANYTADQLKSLTKLAGGEANVAEVKALAKAALERVRHLPFARNLSQSAFLDADAWTLLTLANTERMHQAYSNLKRKRSK